MKSYKVSQVKELLGVSHVTIHKKLRNHKKELQGLVFKKKKTTYLKPEAVTFLESVIGKKNKSDIDCNKVESSEEKNVNTFDDVIETNEPLQLKLQKKLQTGLQDQIKQLQKQIEMMSDDMKGKDTTINKLIDRQSENEERLQTIIMKLTQDLDQTRKLIEDKIVKKDKKKKEAKKTDRVISIQEFINAKIEEDLEKSNFESEKRRLKQKHEDPLQGRSTLYRIYVKMFHPDRMRREAQ